MKAIKTLVLSGLILFAATAAYAHGPEEIEINGGKRGSVTLPHHLHQDTLKSCSPCHDVFPKELGIIDKMKAEKTLKKKFVMNKTCIACHKEYKKAGKDYGPTSCNGCHVKK